MDHNLPSLSSTYAEFVSLLDERLDDITVGLDPAVTVSAPTNLKIGAIRWLASESKWQKYAGGTTWNDLAATYAISISGSSANTATLSGLSLANTEGGTGPSWNTVPRINTTGLTEIGISLDFHNIANDTNDYSIRLGTGSTTTDLFITPQGGTATKILTVANILSSNVSISGNAGTVTNGVYTSGNQTIAGTKTFSSTIVGNIIGNATTVTDGVYLTTSQTLTNKTLQGLKEVRVALSANDIDISAGNIFTKTIAANTTFTVSNVPATGTYAVFALELTNAGTYTITWWASIKWAEGTPPTLTSSGRDVLAFYTHDAGATWTGLVLGKDIK